MDSVLDLIGDGGITSPWIQGVLIIASTFILEDPTTIGCGLLVAEGVIAWQTAFLSLWLGIAVGDMTLYALGRFLGPQALRWGLLEESRLERARKWFDKNLFLAVILSRFVPGMRWPAYVGAGLFRASAHHFLLFTITATLAWTTFLLGTAIFFGAQILPLLGRFRWPAAILVLVLIVLLQRMAHKKINAEEPATPHPVEPAPVSYFEFWPPVLFYLPVGLWYVLLAIRYRSFTLPAAANPAIHAGGLIYESKGDILDLTPDSHLHYIAPYARFCHVRQGDIDAAEDAMAAAGVTYPIVAKPDKGQRGNGVQPVESRGELAAYLEAFPVGQEVLLQQRVPWENEVGILYYRMPDAETGEIFSVTRKHFPTVEGDGDRTLRQLIEADPRARLLTRIYFPRHADRLDEVIPEGEEVSLVFSGSHAAGAIFKDGRALLTPELEQRIDSIARALPEFHFGRFDIRFQDEESLRAGENLQIVEINGAGAEATHIWDADARLRDAYKTLFQQFTILFMIGDQNRRRGHRAVGPVQFVRDCLAYRRLSRDYPATR